jgi:VIT1/CCC1 family predicted Fe2+/Mn2+ transporter
VNLLSRNYPEFAVPLCPDSLGEKMLYTIISILVVLWLLGFVGHIGGGLIHALIVVALCLFLFKMFTGRSTGI